MIWSSAPRVRGSRRRTSLYFVHRLISQTMISKTLERSFTAIGGTVKGVAHRVNGKPNQDALSLPRESTGRVVSVAGSDGHGSDQYFRSDFGSHAAAVAGRRVLRAALTPSKRDRLAAAARQELVTTRIPRCVYRDWRTRVEAHLAECPLSDFELARLSPSQEAEVRVNPAIAYGCTLLAAGLGPTFGALLRIGDGTVAVIDHDEQLHRPFREDHRGGDESTASLCSSSAASMIETAYLDYADGPPRCVVCATDGYTKSFAGAAEIENALFALYEHVAKHGVDDFERGLREMLDNTTKHGSGDDTTVVMVVNQSVFAGARSS